MPAMPISSARLEANRKNAQRSTGPRTDEGKAASRANSLKHGMTGPGIVTPMDDAEKIERTSRELEAHYRPATAYGRSMLGLMAAMMARADRLGRYDLALVAAQVKAAVEAFDAARLAIARELFANLATDPEALASLLQSPEGLDLVIAEWAALAAIPAWGPDEIRRIFLISGWEVNDTPAVRELFPAAVDHFTGVRDAFDRAPIDRARRQAADLALFSTSPEATLSRKYEAATLRMLTKARKEYHEAEGSVEPASPPAPVASFSPGPAAEVEPPTEPARVAPVEAEEIDAKPPVDRSRRPDPRKMLEAQRRKRR